jgi:hypothetical protein
MAEEYLRTFYHFGVRIFLNGTHRSLHVLLRLLKHGKELKQKNKSSALCPASKDEAKLAVLSAMPTTLINLVISLHTI